MKFCHPQLRACSEKEWSVASINFIAPMLPLGVTGPYDGRCGATLEVEAEAPEAVTGLISKTKR